MYFSTYVYDLKEALLAIPPATLYALATHVLSAWKNGRTVFTCGNGGSASNASHLAQDLSKGTLPLFMGVKPMRTICLCDNVSALTAWANDNGYMTVFANQLQALGQPGDLLIAISGSGNSPNVLNAVNMAHDLEIRTWGITGFDGGLLLNLAHRCVHVECDDMGMVEAAHGVLFHWLVDAVREARAEELSIMDVGAASEKAEGTPLTLPPFNPPPIKFLDDESYGSWCPGVEEPTP